MKKTYALLEKMIGEVRMEGLDELVHTGECLQYKGMIRAVIGRVHSLRL